jgi:hypothetical protein
LRSLLGKDKNKTLNLLLL